MEKHVTEKQEFSSESAKKKGLIAAAVLACAAVVLDVVLIALTKEENETLMRILTIAVSFVLLSAALYLLLNVAGNDSVILRLKLRKLTSGKGGKTPGFLRRIGSDILLYLTLLFFTALILTFVMNIRTNVGPKDRLTVYVDTENDLTETGKELKLALSDSGKRITVRPFSYALFDGSELQTGDLFLVREGGEKEYETLFADGSEYLKERPELERAETESGIAGVLLTFSGEPYTLFFGVNSVHTGSEDDLAYRAADFFISLEIDAR